MRRAPNTEAITNGNTAQALLSEVRKRPRKTEKGRELKWNNLSIKMTEKLRAVGHKNAISESSKLGILGESRKKRPPMFN